MPRLAPTSGCALTCCCKSCGPLSIFTYKAGGDGREGLVHDDKDVKTDDGEMSAACILATSSRDRQGDIIECSGVDLTEHSWNPIVLWDHGRQTNIPIGVTESPEGEYTVVYHPDDDILVQKTYFAPDKFSTQIYALIKGRFIRANSIAVKDLEVEKIPADPDAGHFKAGKHILRSALAEVTWTPLPANAEAVASLITSGRIEGGGFAREEIHPLILKSLLPFAPTRNRNTSNGYTIKSQPTGPAPATEKRVTPMPDNIRAKAGEEHDLMEPEAEGNETLHKDLPPGAQFLHDHHDLTEAHKAMLDEHARRQEHPGVRELIEAHKDMLDTMAQEVRDRFGDAYPDHEGPQEEKSEEADVAEESKERTTPESVNANRGRPGSHRDGDGEGDRVEEEKKSARKRAGMSKKAYDTLGESTSRSLARAQADFYAEQQLLAEMENELAQLEAQ